MSLRNPKRIFCNCYLAPEALRTSQGRREGGKEPIPGLAKNPGPGPGQGLGPDPGPRPGRGTGAAPVADPGPGPRPSASKSIFTAPRMLVSQQAGGTGNSVS